MLYIIFANKGFKVISYIDIRSFYNLCLGLGLLVKTFCLKICIIAIANMRIILLYLLICQYIAC